MRIEAVENHTYFMSAAAGPLHPVAQQRAQDFLNEMSAHGDIHWEDNVAEIEDTRALLAKMLRCEASEVGFTSSASMAMNFFALLLKSRLGNGVQFSFPKDEFPSSTLPWYHLSYQGQGFSTRDGISDPKQWRQGISAETKIFIHSHIQYGTGFRLSLKDFSDFCGSQNLISCLNATQSLGVFPIDLSQIDFACGSIHKWLMAGYGLSFFKISKSYLDSLPMAGWLSQEDPWSMNNENLSLMREARALELGCAPLMQIFCVGAVLRWIESEGGFEAISQKVMSRRQEFLDLLKSEEIPILYDFDSSHASGMIFIKSDHPDEDLKIFENENIFLSARGGALRLAVHWFNRTQDFERFVQVYKTKIRKA